MDYFKDVRIRKFNLKKDELETYHISIFYRYKKYVIHNYSHIQYFF